MDGIAIVGMACRFPGARSPEAFWENLRQGREAIEPLTDEMLEAAGVGLALRSHPQYVKAAANIDGIEWFDAGFFGYNPREAALIDPQQRIFLEVAWEALERAGTDPEQYPGRVGVFAGTGFSTYLIQNLIPNMQRLAADGLLASALYASDKDYLSTRLAYKLNLTGPSLTVQTACSTSLVAVSLACQSLFNYQCDMALAGGVSIRVPQRTGYLYQEGGILSPDGHCRAFDANAQGTIFGDGAGVIALKRLEDALADGDRIEAVILGYAINNDGAGKVGFTAPGVSGQAEVIREALAMAGVEPGSIGYIETHGTATPLGDRIEVEALNHVFGGAAPTGSIAIGSVKTQVGHLNAAAGVAGLIKAALALRHGALPPSLHFAKPNPGLELERTPFRVQASLEEWKGEDGPHRAGVSSFGIGGTNAHVILQEPEPEPMASARDEGPQLLVLSARTPTALEKLTADLSAHLQADPDLPLADVAATLQLGRRAQPMRRCLVAGSTAEAARLLAQLEPGRVLTGGGEVGNRNVVFLFPGQGSQHVQMGRELYTHCPTFRRELDRCADLFAPHLGRDLREVAGVEALRRTELAQPALFAVEYALAQLWREWGVQPQAMIGHSVGEYVAACLSGVMSLADAVRLVAVRGRLMQSLPGGAMLTVMLPEQEVAPLLDGQVAVAAVNAPNLCVLSGPTEAVAALEEQLMALGVECRRLFTSHAFHSPMTEPILEPFARLMGQVKLQPPETPFISNVTGTWITPEEATDPDHWVRHLRRTVRFGEGAATLLQDPDALLLEVGPGRALTTLVRQFSGAAGRVRNALPPVQGSGSERVTMLEAAGWLWLSGVRLTWPSLHQEGRRRVLLPTYPFERQRYWIEGGGGTLPAACAAAPEPAADGAPVLRRSELVAPRTEMEELIASVWSRLLGIEQISIHDNFFALGGHSLLASQVIAQVRQFTPVEVPLTLLFEHPTVAGLGAAIEDLLLQALEGMSDEEAARVVASGRPDGGEEVPR